MTDRVGRSVASLSAAAMAVLSDGEWHTTPEIGREIGLEWPKGRGPIKLRQVLYALFVADVVEIDQRQNGHRWRRKS